MERPGNRPAWAAPLPDWGETRFLVVAGLVWAGTLAGAYSWGIWAATAAGAAMVLTKRSGVALVMAAGLVAGALAGWGAASRATEMLAAPVVEGEVTVRAVARTDPRGSRDRPWLVARPLAYRFAEDQPWREWLGPVMMVNATHAGELAAGEIFEASGQMVKETGRRGTSVYSARMWTGVLARVSPAQGWLVRSANAVRRRVMENLRTGPPDGLGLVAGFLVGDTTGLTGSDLADLRRSGLSHYVAVSGGNVALFLGALWILMWPVASRPRLRSLVGLVALGVFMIVTRWEPSVLRAGLLAALTLGARAVGLPLGSWAALGTTVVLALLVSAELAESLGFALSVAATLGVMAGMRIGSGRRPRWVWETLGAALAAQVAVAPLLLGSFGSVPLLSPVANLAAAPLVAASTILGGIGSVTGWQPLVGLAAIAAEGVLAVSRFLSPFPQLGWLGTAVAFGAGFAAWRWSDVRLPMLTTAVLVLAVVRVFPLLFPLVGSDGAGPPAVVFLDVGQGDSILVLGTAVTILIDGGPDPATLAEKLRKYRVSEVDLLVITHPHADHVRGLEAVVGRMPVGAVWDASYPHETPAYLMLTERIAEEGIPVQRPSPGQVLRAGELEVEVMGPQRRYKHVNDQSIVLVVHLAGTDYLMAADIQDVAQAELGDIRPDVLKVPHQGAATSDRQWLRANAGRLAVISVGPNDYGHPVPWVERTLAEAGARVVRTDRHGDVVVKPARTRRVAAIGQGSEFEEPR
ncbi:MAG: ComEC/Rec2 family competence protein [bacterium]|nr:ComEC/Rec2 family competence protein [bacterium]MDE0602155.1 ComEC/Rec2 family competence protein [bacterium]